MEATSDRNEILHKGNLGDDDDARTLNTPIVQRNHATLGDEKCDVHYRDIVKYAGWWVMCHL